MEKPIIQSSHHGNHKQPQGLWETLVCKSPPAPMLLCSLHKMRNFQECKFFFLTFCHYVFSLHLSSHQGNIHIFSLPDLRIKKNRSVAGVSLRFFFLTRLSLPRGEKGTLAVKGLCEGVAECDHASLAAWSAALHYHPGHLNQLDGALPVLQCLGQVQHLVTNRFHDVWNADMQKPCAVNETWDNAKLCNLEISKIGRILRGVLGILPQKKKTTLWVHCRAFFYF